jgi:hypothetical protein
MFGRVNRIGSFAVGQRGVDRSLQSTKACEEPVAVQAFILKCSGSATVRGVAMYNKTHGLVDILGVRRDLVFGWEYFLAAHVGELPRPGFPKTHANLLEHHWSRKG